MNLPGISFSKSRVPHAFGAGFILLALCLRAVGADAAFSLHQIRSFGFLEQLGMYPSAPLIEATDGFLYGTCGGGDGSGVVFKLNKDGSGYRTLHRFGDMENDGFGAAGVIEASDGALYGITTRGGSNVFYWGNLYGGTVFKLNKDGSDYRILHHFGDIEDGQNPQGKIIEGSDGALYGTTTEGGVASGATLFKLNKGGGEYTRLHEFGFFVRPVGGVIEGADGALYGTTERDGSYAAGTVFKINKDGSSYDVLHHFAGSYRFNGDDGAYPRAALLPASDGALYGTTSIGGATNSGTVFRMNPDGSGYRTLHSFNIYDADGSYPICNLIEGTNGMLYGTTSNGGSNGMGTVFMLGKEGRDFATVHWFSYGDVDGLYPAGGLLKSGEGILYGATVNGGAHRGGTVFRINGDGSVYQILRNFIFAGGDGATPSSGLVEGPEGVLFGTTPFGGSGSCQGSGNEWGCGTVFRVAKDGSDYHVLHRFGDLPDDGKEPTAAVLLGKDGLLYGTTRSGGSNGVGTIFRLNPDGTAYTLLHNFSVNGPDGHSPQAELIQGSEGSLYGVTSSGGNGFSGTLFKLNPDGTGFSVLHSFTFADGRPQAGLIEGSDDMLYGTTPEGGNRQFGSVFRLNKAGGAYLVLHSFHYDGVDGIRPYAGVIEGGDGKLYGTTTQGGTNNNGAVFRLNKDGSGYELLHSFESLFGDGELPIGGVLEGPDGVLYGTTAYGGSMPSSLGFGTAYRLNKDGSGYTNFSFDATRHGAINPASSLMMGSDGAIYGTTRAGGEFGIGTIYRLLKPLVLEPPVRIDGQGFRLSVRGHPGLQIRIQRSVDMATWTDWLTFTMGASPVEFSDTSSESPLQKFYRAVFP